MKIGLFGFTMAHENMGCQALTCSFIEMLQRLYVGHLDIVVFDNETTLGGIPECFPDIHFELQRVSLRSVHPIFMDKVKSCDIVFDVTAGDGFSDIYFVKGTYRDTVVKIMCGQCTTPFVLLPQTYGPFAHRSLEVLAGVAIRKAQHAYARDLISSRYAEKISNRKVLALTDMAFGLEYKPTLEPGEKRLGINVSGLLWHGGFSSANQFGLTVDYKEYCKTVIEKALVEGYEVHLIPHVTISGDPNHEVADGDYPVCSMLAEEFKEVYLAPCFRSPYEAKNYIASMNIFTGARMHATIGAFSAGVITIPFAYSRKFQGLYDNLGYSYYVDGTRETTENAVTRTFQYIDNWEHLAFQQKTAMKKVRTKLDETEKLVQGLLDLYSTPK